MCEWAKLSLLLILTQGLCTIKNIYNRKHYKEALLPISFNHYFSSQERNLEVSHFPGPPGMLQES